MSRKPGFHYRDTPREVLDLFCQLSIGGPGTTIHSTWDTAAAIHAFRNRIYRWRRSMLDVLSHTEKDNREEQEEALEWIDQVLPHPYHMFVKDFFYLTIFQIEEHPTDPKLFRLKGTIRKPLYQSPEKIVEPTSSSIEEAMALLARAGVKEDL